MLKKLNNKGFTIIEVLIVLAIAGVIMLVVFLAVPALQRNSRNTQRTSDAALITSGVNECLTNRNGVIGSCDVYTAAVGATPAAELGLTIDPAKLRQLGPGNTGAISVSAAYAANLTPNAAGSTNVADVRIIYGSRCTPDSASYEQGNARQFVVLYFAENTTGGTLTRCIDS